MEVLGLQKSQLRYPCPLDAFFHDNCWKGQGGDVCIFPGAVLKKINKGYFHEEFDSFTRLTETRFFPKLYYADENCQTILQENVRLPGETENMWCSNYTHYKDFYISAFRVFTAKNIIPVDLNTCCNTVVNDDHIRIIDFGNYRFHQKPEKVLNMNTMLLKNILNDVKETVAAHRHICDRRDRERISESSDWFLWQPIRWSTIISEDAEDIKCTLKAKEPAVNPNSLVRYGYISYQRSSLTD